MPEKRTAVKDEASSLIRTVGVCWVTSAIAALDLDPWLLHPATVVLKPPNRRSVMDLALIGIVFGLSAILVPCVLKVGRGTLVWMGGVVTLVLMFLGPLLSVPLFISSRSS